MTFLSFSLDAMLEPPSNATHNFTTHTPHSPFQKPIPSRQYTQSHYSNSHATYSLSCEPCHTNTTSKAYSPPLPPHHPNQYLPPPPNHLNPTQSYRHSDQVVVLLAEEVASSRPRHLQTLQRKSWPC